MKKEVENLSLAQESLLGCYFDGECGFLGRIRAKSLLKNNQIARDFLRDLAKVKEELHLRKDDCPNVSEDVWSKILDKIELQERLRLIEEMDTGKQRVLDFCFTRIGMGALGGALAAVLIVMIQLPDQTQQSAISGMAASQMAQPVQLASNYPNPSVGEASFINSDGLTPSFSKLRSSGRVKVIRQPSEHSTIFWIKKRPPALLVAPDTNKTGVFYLDPSMAVDPLLQGD